LAGVDEATTEDDVVVAARRWRFLLLLLLVLAFFEAVDAAVGFAVAGAVVLIFATAVGATGEPVIEVVVRTALGLCADIWDRTDEIAASVF